MILSSQNNQTMLHQYSVLHSLIIVSDPCSTHQGVHFILAYYISGGYINDDLKKKLSFFRVIKQIKGVSHNFITFIGVHTDKVLCCDQPTI